MYSYNGNAGLNASSKGEIGIAYNSTAGVQLHNIGNVDHEELVGAKGLKKGAFWTVQAIYINPETKVSHFRFELI